MTAQEPVAGSQRHRRAMLVGQWLKRNTGASTTARYSYSGIASAIGLSIPAVQHAVYDLRTFFTDEAMIISVPCQANGWTVEVGWRPAAKQGGANQLRHLASRDLSIAILMERAAAEEPNAGLAFAFRTEARYARDAAARHKDLAEVMESGT